MRTAMASPGSASSSLSLPRRASSSDAELTRLGALLGALLWAGLGTPAGGQHANDRVVFSFTSSATLKDSIAGADRPYSNDSRLPNASVVTLVETDTAGYMLGV